MLNEKEKRIFLIVILATALVSLITAVIGGWISWLMDLIETSGYNVDSKAVLDFAMQALLFAMGTASIFLFFFNKSRRDLAHFILFGCEAALTLAITIYYFCYGSYSYGRAFLALGLAVAVSSMFVALASFFLAKNRAKTEEKTQE